jgi:hypothetical protein
VPLFTIKIVNYAYFHRKETGRKNFGIATSISIFKKKIKSLENKLATSERKRQRLMEDIKKNSVAEVYPFSR